jgi:hypothetical protein
MSQSDGAHRCSWIYERHVGTSRALGCRSRGPTAGASDGRARRPAAACRARPAPLTARNKNPTQKTTKNQVAFAGLLLKGRQSLKELLRSTRLPPDQLRHALLALITHNLVRAYSEAPENGSSGGGGGGGNTAPAAPSASRPTKQKGGKTTTSGKRRGSSSSTATTPSPCVYEGDLDAALWTSVRRPAFLAWVARRWPRAQDRLLAEAVVEVLLAEGRLRVDQVAALAARRAAELAAAESKARAATGGDAGAAQQQQNGNGTAPDDDHDDSDDDGDDEQARLSVPLTSPTPHEVLRVFRELVEDARLVERAPPCDLRPPFPPVYKPPRKGASSAAAAGGGGSAAAKRQRERDMEEEMRRRDPSLDEYLEVRFLVPRSHDYGGVEDGDGNGGAWPSSREEQQGAGGAAAASTRKRRGGAAAAGGEAAADGPSSAKRRRRGGVIRSSSEEEEEHAATVKPEPMQEEGAGGAAGGNANNAPPPSSFTLPAVTPSAYHRAVLWRANLEQLNRVLRREDVVAHVRGRLGEDSATVARAMLELGEAHEYSRRQGFAPARGPWLTVADIARRIRDAGCGGLSMTLAAGATLGGGGGGGGGKRAASGGGAGHPLKAEEMDHDDDDENGDEGEDVGGSSSSLTDEEEEERERARLRRLQRGGEHDDGNDDDDGSAPPLKLGPGDRRGRRAAQASWRADGGARLRAEVAEVLERRLACDPAGFVLASPHQPPLAPPREARLAAAAAAGSSGRPSRAALRRALRARDADLAARQYRLAHGAVVAFEKLRWLRCALKGRYGERGLRAFNLLLQRGFLEQRQVAEQCLSPLREARELLYRMLRDGALQLQDVPRSADRTAPSRSAYLFGADPRRAADRLGQDVLLAMARAHARRRHELAPAREILPKVAAARAAGRLTFNLPPEDLKRLHAMVRRGKALDALLLRLDAQSALFNNW